jgi:signal transduction histidine kinase
MRVSLRTLVIGVFVLLALASCVQNILAVAVTVRSASQVTSLYRHGLVPVVGSEILNQNLYQERALLANDIARMTPDRARALYDEVADLDVSITTAAGHMLLADSLPDWRAQWARFLVARTAYLDAMRHRRAGRLLAQLRDHLANQLDAAQDVVQHDAGLHLYAGEQLYTTAMMNDWTALRIAIFSLVAVLVVGAGLAVLVALRLTRGLGNLVETARAITHGHATVRADERGRDEIALLARTFNRMMDALLSAERRADGERSRIARDLHDSVLQDLVANLQSLQVMHLQSHDVAMDVVMEQEIAALQNAVHGMRTAIYDLRAEQIQGQPLSRVLQDVVRRNRQTAPGLDIGLTVEDGFPAAVPDIVKVELSRLLQEALINVRRHASARHVAVTLGGAGQEVWMEVTDDGHGFAPDALHGGVGLASMRERAGTLGGTLEIRSAIGQGTVVRLLTSRPALLRVGPELRVQPDIPGPAVAV